MNLKNDKNIPPIGLTMGDPGGIGPDITILTWLSRSKERVPKFVYIGNEALLNERAKLLNKKIKTNKITNITDKSVIDDFDKAIPVIDLPIASTSPNRFEIKNNSSIINSINTAYQLVKDGALSALVTNPVNKNSLQYANKNFSGQTELLGYISKTEYPVMMLVSKMLKVVPLTRHIPISEIPKNISSKLIIATTKTLIDSVDAYFCMRKPRIAITGLNPHSGDSGLIGKEEIDIIDPAIKILKKNKLNVRGPLSADSLFNKDSIRSFDIAVCMYHDQALIPIKTLAHFATVNVTLGLDIVRTSPDHGTAYQHAGKGSANNQSLFNSLHLAEKMVQNYARKRT